MRRSSPSPRSAQTRRFVGLVIYYCKFLPVTQFSTLTPLLTTLCSPHARFTWGNTKQRSFKTLKAALTSAPVLHVWDSACPTHLLIDVSEQRRSSLSSLPSSSS